MLLLNSHVMTGQLFQKDSFRKDAPAPVTHIEHPLHPTVNF